MGAVVPPLARPFPSFPFQLVYLKLPHCQERRHRPVSPHDIFMSLINASASVRLSLEYQCSFSGLRSVKVHIHDWITTQGQCRWDHVPNGAYGFYYLEEKMLFFFLITLLSIWSKKKNGRCGLSLNKLGSTWLSKDGTGSQVSCLHAVALQFPFPGTTTLFTLSIKMSLGQSDHKWTALNRSVNDHQDTFTTHSRKPLAEVVQDPFDHISFKYSVNTNVSGCIPL